MTGAGAVWVIENMVETGGLFVYPTATAIAVIVSELLTVIGDAYCVEFVVGTVPSVV